MTYTKGGRGKKAPYTTTHVRIPTQIKPLIDKITARFKELVNQPEALEDSLSSIADCIDDQKAVNSLSEINITKEETLELAKKLMKAKKSKKDTIEKLLTSIYGGDISLD